MGYRLTKDIQDVYFRSKSFVRDIVIDRYGPVKYDAFESLLQTYLEVLPVVAKRIDAIEEHLDKGIAEGKSFVRAEERPDVGEASFESLTGAVNLLAERLDRIENTRTAKAATTSTST